MAQKQFGSSQIFRFPRVTLFIKLAGMRARVIADAVKNLEQAASLRAGYHQL